MLNPPLRRKLVLLTLAGALLLPVSTTAAPRTRRAPVRTETPQAAAASFLQNLGARLVALWNGAGCELDPSGQCLENPGEPGPSGAQPGQGHGSSVGAHGNPLDQ